jgi:hypothetical protein
LSDTHSFEGGGTVFPDLEEMWAPDIGSGIFYAGMNLHGARRVTQGLRYVLAGFVAYGDTPFRLDLYQPEYDGFAAQAGFENGDLIAGGEVCEPEVQEQGEDRQAKGKGKGMDEPRKLRRHMHPINTSTSDEEWIQAAQSCELLAYGQPTKLMVRRRVESHGGRGRGRGSGRGRGDEDDQDDYDEYGDEL